MIDHQDGGELFFVLFRNQDRDGWDQDLVRQNFYNVNGIPADKAKEE